MMAQRSCCVPRCGVKLGDGVILHRFPNPNNPDQVERFRTWIIKVGNKIVGEDNNFIYKNCKVCHKHFEPIYTFPNMRLSTLAIPTLQIPGAPMHRTGHSAHPIFEVLSTSALADNSLNTVVGEQIVKISTNLIIEIPSASKQTEISTTCTDMHINTSDSQTGSPCTSEINWESVSTDMHINTSESQTGSPSTSEINRESVSTDMHINTSDSQTGSPCTSEINWESVSTDMHINNSESQTGSPSTSEINRESVPTDMHINTSELQSGSLCTSEINRESVSTENDREDNSDVDEDVDSDNNSAADSDTE